VLPRGNQNALTELAPEISLHLISCFALTWRLRRRRRPASLYGRTVHDMNWNGLLASVVAAARPRGGAISDVDKNAPKAHHTAKTSQLGRKVNVCLRSTAGGAFFPRRLGARRRQPPMPAK